MHRREESRPNALWQADHAQLDILLLREDGATARPWLTAIIDDHSRAIAGYYLAGVSLPEVNLTPEVIALFIRITSGSLRLLTRLLTQIERILSVNDTPEVSAQIVEAARDSLVIGQA